MLDGESSLRLNLLRFPLIVGVVFIHAYESTALFAGNEIGVSQPNCFANFVRNFISQGVARTAVPLFFLMAGFLFFEGFEWSKKKYIMKLRSRIKSLLFPYLFWNIVTLSIIALGQAMPLTQIYFSGRIPLVAGFSLIDYLNAITGFNPTGCPIAYQFWFIRDLMMLVVLVPLIYHSLRVAPIVFVGIILLCWFLGVWPFLAPSSEATLFFCVGAYLALIQKSLFAADKYGSMLVLPYVIIVAFNAIFIEQPFYPFLHKIGIVLGVLVALSMSKALVRTERLKSFILWLSSTSFFVFAIHEPLLRTLRKVSYKVISPDSSALILLLYFALPSMVVVFSVVAYRVVLRVAPNFVSDVTGGRSSTSNKPSKTEATGGVRRSR
jgi:surface polysaccharide O-acyltransferase-like enzyme